MALELIKLSLTKVRKEKFSFDQMVNVGFTTAAVTPASLPTVVVYLYVPEGDTRARVRWMQMWANSFEIIAAWTIKRAFVAVTAVPIGATVASASGGGGMGQRPEEIILGVMWGVGGSTQSSNTEYNYATANFVGDEMPGVVGSKASVNSDPDGSNITPKQPTGIALFFETASTASNPGMVAWVIGRLEIEYEMKFYGDRASEFSGIQDFEDSHDHQQDQMM